MDLATAPIKNVSIKYFEDSCELTIDLVDTAGGTYGRRIGHCPWDKMPIDAYDTRQIERVILAGKERSRVFKRAARFMIAAARLSQADERRKEQGRPFSGEGLLTDFCLDVCLNEADD